MKDHENTKFIEDITFQQIKMVTKEANARLSSFDRQFSGCFEVIA